MMQDDALDDIEYFDFFQDACAALARNACLLLRLAGEPVTPENALEIIHSAPRTHAWLDTEFWQRSYCNALLERACTRQNSARGLDTWLALHDYFKLYLTRIRPAARRMLDAAFIGVLEEIPWEAPKPGKKPARQPPPLPQPAERRPGPIERWAARRGW